MNFEIQFKSDCFIYRFAFSTKAKSRDTFVVCAFFSHHTSVYPVSDTRKHTASIDSE